MSRPESNYGAVPAPNTTHHAHGYGSSSIATTGVADFAQGNPSASGVSPLSQSMNNNTAFNTNTNNQDLSASRRESIVPTEDGLAGPHRATSSATTAVPSSAPARSNTLRKKASIRRNSSLKRSSSKRSLKAGSLAGFGGVDVDKDFNSAFSTPIPTQGTPTEILANRFQAWRQLLKSLITYFREIQASYEQRAKATHKVQGIIANIQHPAIFMSENGLSEATRALDEYHKRTVAEANKSREIENDVIGALTGLRSDLGQKIKEIKSLSGDFKNSVEKEKDGTRREVEKLQEALRLADHDGDATGKNDPFVVRLGVDRAVERQLDEENYLHRAYLNLESSGRELESIVVGEIQKAYNALAGILKREGDDAYHTVEALRTGPISMPKDAEWLAFVQHDPHFVDPSIPLRRVEDIEYPGKNDPAAAEVRSGMLERKSKYLKSYTPGWYVLSPTHLHEFKSADKIYTQPPVMSLYLPDQKLGSHSQPGSSSHKFMVKGKQSGNMHKGHNWVFRAESYDTMMAWFEDMRILTEKTGEERTAYVRKHARSFSGNHSDRATVSSDGMEDDDDEADAVPYSADAANLPSGADMHSPRPQRPAPGGRFPSDMQVLQVPRDRAVSMGQSSGSEDEREAGGLVGGGTGQDEYGDVNPYRLDGVSGGTYTGTAYTERGEYFGETPAVGNATEHPVYQQQEPAGYYGPQTVQQPANTMQTVQQPTNTIPQPVQTVQQPAQPEAQQSFLGSEPVDARALPAQDTNAHGEWIAPAAAGVVGAGAAGVAATAYHQHKNEDEQPAEREIKPEMPEAIIVPAVVPVATTQASAATAPIEPTPVAEPVPITSTTELGGLEAEGAQETGAIFPKVVRHNTAMSVSQLHVPGEYPKRD